MLASGRATRDGTHLLFPDGPVASGRPEPPERGSVRRGCARVEACFARGAIVVPAGAGNIRLPALACHDLGLTAYIGLPSYLRGLLETAEELRLEPISWALRRAFVAAEPLPRRDRVHHLP